MGLLVSVDQFIKERLTLSCGLTHPHPPIHVLMSLLPVPQNVTVFGNRVIADVIKMRLYWSKMGP